MWSGSELHTIPVIPCPLTPQVYTWVEHVLVRTCLCIKENTCFTSPKIARPEVAYVRFSDFILYLFVLFKSQCCHFLPVTCQAVADVALQADDCVCFQVAIGYHLVQLHSQHGCKDQMEKTKMNKVSLWFKAIS